MNVAAAFILCKLSGKEPDADNISAIISAAGGEADSEKIDLLIKELGEKDAFELIAAGKESLKNVSLGGGGGGGGGGGSGGGSGVAEDAPKVEEKVEEEIDMGGAMDMFGGGGDGY